MSSEQKDCQPQSEPKPCANNCGFFGSAATMDLCSKCFRDRRIRDEQAASAKAAMERSLNPKPEQIPEIKNFSNDDRATSSSSEPSETSAGVPDPAVPTAAKNRCWSCNRKVGFTAFTCKCGSTFCGTHRYPEKHGCTFDYKSAGREAIAKANPVVKADKIGS